MQGILIATLVVGVVGLVLGLALVTASKKFYVETDERVTQVRECLRGANCGACGYAGCDALAETIVKGDARVDACPGNSTENIAKIAAILGKETVTLAPLEGCTVNSCVTAGTYTKYSFPSRFTSPTMSPANFTLLSNIWTRSRAHDFPLASLRSRILAAKSSCTFSTFMQTQLSANTGHRLE